MTDVFSWGDSDPFEEDDSWMSEPESVCNNWRGWKKIPGTPGNAVPVGIAAGSSSGGVGTLGLGGPSVASTSGLLGQSAAAAGVSGAGLAAAGPSHVGALSAAVASSSSLAHGAAYNGAVSGTLAAVATLSTSRLQTNSSACTVGGTIGTLSGAVAAGSSLSHHPHHHTGGALNAVEMLRRTMLECQGVHSHRPTSPTTTILNAALRDSGSRVLSLTELSARIVASYIPFEVVERFTPPVPEQLQLRIAFWSFPDNEEDIRLYSCLANGSADEFQKGESLYRSRAVQSLLQIGFHLSATVSSPALKSCTVAVTFDRGRITSCSCTCNCPSSWCSHVVAVCLHRIYQPASASFRAPVAESLSRLDQLQLKKFAQYLINEFPQQILPTAQRLLDELLSEESSINALWGAPDPTAGALIADQTKWCLDENQLHDNIRKIVIKLCIPSPMVYSDVNYLSATAPPAASEWTSLLRPLRGREPEGLWNLLSIVREMLRRHDRNSIPLLKILTEEILTCDQILLWWFNTNVSLHRGLTNGTHAGGGGGGGGGGGNGGGNGGNNNGGGNRNSIHSNIHASQHACSSLCDEIVLLWRLVTLNPALPPGDTHFLFEQLREYHLQTLSIVVKFKPQAAHSQTHSSSFGASMANGSAGGSVAKTSDIEIFSGFKPAMVSCLIDWNAYPIHGVTNAYTRNPYCPSINAQSSSTSSCNHAISGTVKTLGAHHPWSKALVYSKQSSSESSADGGVVLAPQASTSTARRSAQHALARGPRQHSNDNSEDSGNNDAWDRASSGSSGLDEAVVADPVLVVPGVDVIRGSGVQAQLGNAEEDYRIYVFNSRTEANKNIKTTGTGTAAAGGLSSGEPRKVYEPQLLAAASVKPIEDSFEILFSRAEALYAHGYVPEACQLSVQLAEQLLNNPPVLQLESETSQTQTTPMLSASTSQPSTSAAQPTTSGTFMVAPGTSATPATSTSTPLLQAPSSSTSSISLTGGGGSGRSHVKRALRHRFNPALHQVSLLASATLSKAAFLCQVLSEHESSHLLAFHVGLLGLELVRPPASTKALEVKLANQEQELVNSLKRIPLCSRALAVLREKAEQLRDGRLTTRGEALLPLILASYIFDALVLSNGVNGSSSAAYALNALHSSFTPTALRLATDERLAFEASVAAIGLKANVSEAAHPLLCEGTRRQRGDLALTLLVHYKDNKERLGKIMEKLLDKEIHQIHRKASGSTTTYSMLTEARPNSKTTSTSSSKQTQHISELTAATLQAMQASPARSAGGAHLALEANQSVTVSIEPSEPSVSNETRSTPSAGPSTCSSSTTGGNWDEEYKNWEAKFRQMNLHNGNCVETASTIATKGSTNSPATTANPSSRESSAPETTSSDNSPTLSRRNLFLAATKATASGGVGGGSDSSGESSDSLSVSSSNSEKARRLLDAAASGATEERRPMESIAGPSTLPTAAEMTFSDMSASGIIDLANSASDGSTFQSFNRAYSLAASLLTNGPSSSSSNGASPGPKMSITPTQPAAAATAAGLLSHPQAQSPPQPQAAAAPVSSFRGPMGKNTTTYPGVSSTGGCVSLKSYRYGKGKRGNIPLIPNQPSDASAHFMFELAKTVLAKAGGTSGSSVLFTQPPTTSNCRAPHRNLHMCAFQIGLYALGLHNAVSANWLSRTYSSQVSWITGQAMEIGQQAIAFLIDTWEGHFTPPEVASLADRASRGQDTYMVQAAASLALSCLPHAHALTPSEIQRALIQCKEQSNEMLERACLAVEQAAQGGGVYPEVLFHVARKWHELYEHEVRTASDNTPPTSNPSTVNASSRRHGNVHGAPPAVSTSQATLPSHHHQQQQQQPHLSASGDQGNYGEEHQMGANVSEGNGVSGEYSLFYPEGPLLDMFAEDQARVAEMAANVNAACMSAQSLMLSGAGGPGGPCPPNAAVSMYTGQPMFAASPQMYQQAAVAAAAAGYNQYGQRYYPNGARNTFFPSYPPPWTAAYAPNGNQPQPALLPYGPYPASTNAFYHPMLQQAAAAAGKAPLGPQGGNGAPAGAFYYPPLTGGGHHSTSSSLRSTNTYLLPQPGTTQPLLYGYPTPVSTQAFLPYPHAPYGLAQANHQAAAAAAALHQAASGQGGLPNSSSQSAHLSPRQLAYMNAVYRVGMLAMETLARRVHDDRPQTRYARNPPYCEDVKWLLFIAKKLGASYVQELCMCSVNAVASPFVLYDIIMEAAPSLAHGVPLASNSPYLQNIRSQFLSPLIQKCQQLFAACIYFQLLHITTGEYDEFLSTIRAARSAFLMLPAGSLHFNELMQSLKRTKTCKKELWQHITNVMQSSNN